MKTDIIWITNLPKGRLGIAPRPRGGDWLRDEVKRWRESGVDRVVSALTPEENIELDLVNEPTLCQISGLQFTSLPIFDRGVPASATEFQHIIEEFCTGLDAGESILVHCRQGIGRASMIAAAVLTRLGESADAAFARIQRARGRPVPDTEEQRNWVRQFAAHSSGAQRTRWTSRLAGTPKVHA